MSVLIDKIARRITRIGSSLSVWNDHEEQIRVLSRAVEQNPATIMIADKNGHLEYVNPKFTELTGYSSEEVLGKNPRFLKSGQTSSTEYARLWQMILSGGEWHGEFCNKKKNGELYWESASISPIINERGAITHIVAVKEDITKSKRIEARLQESKERYREIVEGANDIVFTADTQGKISYVNPVALRITGYQESELLGKHYLDLVPPEHRQTVESFYGEQLSRGRRTTYLEFPILTKSKTTMWFGHNVRLMKKDGQVVGFQGVARDITRQRLTDELLRKSKERYKQLVETSPDAVLIHNEGIVKYVNASGLRLLHAARQDQVLDHPFSEFVHPDHRAKLIPDVIDAAQEKDFVRPSDVKLIRADGNLAYVEASTIPLDYDDRPSFQVIARDISSRKDAEEKLQASERKFRALIENAYDGVALIESDGRFFYLSPSVERILGYDPSYLVGRYPQEFVPPEDIAGILTPLKALVKKPGAGLVGQYRFRHKDGSWHWLEAIITNLLFDRDVNAIVANFHDVTKRKREEAELLKAKEAAEAATKAKSQFLAVMSHEIRTPMNGVLAVTELLQTTRLTEQQKEFVDTMQSSGKLLLTIINDILDLSKIEYGDIEFQRLPVNVRDCVQEVCDLLRLQTMKKGIRFSFTIDPPVPTNVISDKTRVMQVLFNITGNAVKFTDRGEVSVHVGVQEDEDESCSLVFTVRDTGIGIPKERLHSLFEPFTQIDSSTTRENGGTGLGLSISSKIVARMGGKIFVQSEIGKGSTFTFSLPVPKARETADPSTEDTLPLPEIQGSDSDRPESLLRILVAEDNATNRFVMQQALKVIGYQCDIAVDGIEAVEAERKTEYDVIFMDLHMPKMDGFEATAEIIRMGKNQKLPTIIALTADVPESVKRRCIEYGMSYFLAKPISIRDLKSVLNKVTEENSSTIETPSSAEDETAVSIKDRLHVLGFDADLSSAVEFLQTVYDDMQTNVRDAQSAFEANDSDSLRLHVHSLKGAATNIGAAGLADVCRRIGSNADGSFMNAFGELRADFDSRCLETFRALLQVKDDYSRQIKV